MAALLLGDCGQGWEEPVLQLLEVVQPQRLQRLAAGALQLFELVNPDVAQKLVLALLFHHHILQQSQEVFGTYLALAVLDQEFIYWESIFKLLLFPFER